MYKRQEVELFEGIEPDPSVETVMKGAAAMEKFHRPEFQRMLDNIENGTDEVQFVLVFKLSRFGHNAADVLNSLQRMQDFGVNLILSLIHISPGKRCNRYGQIQI